ncbi:MAG: UDP-N-acetylmuramoyl-tripeptide--D-alanyl-D-alanine ligase [bacterium]|nr:UDP-N-acetylmuramoyl-tripeptide--D-alanyl-D-alanine ligase [bacterium]
MNFLKNIYHLLERKLAARKMSRLGIRVIGITGSYGKTNSAVAITAALSEKYKVAQTDLNLDPIFSIPALIRSLKDEKYVVVELGVDGFGQMRQYFKMIRPSVGVLTGIAPVHADRDHLGSLEGIMKEKGELLSILPAKGYLLCNWDDQRVQEMVSRAKIKIIKYGFSKEADIQVREVKVSVVGTRVKIQIPKGEIELNLKLIGRHHAYTAALAVGIGLEERLSLEQIKKGLEKIEPLAGRMNLENGPAGTFILNDSRRANVASTLAGLETLEDCEAERKIAVLGQMGEMGDYEETGHRQVGKKVAAMKLDYLVCVGPATRFIEEEAKKGLDPNRVFYADDVFEAASQLKELLRPGDLWYLKGSLLKHLERIPLLLKGKKVDSDELASHRYQVYQ